MYLSVSTKVDEGVDVGVGKGTNNSVDMSGGLDMRVNVGVGR
jgi:hypothetical protein